MRVSEQCFLWLCLAIVQHWPYTLGQVAPTSPVHNISIWPLASPWLLSRCHQHLSMLYCAVFLLIAPFFLKVQTSFYNVNGQIWINFQAEQFPMPTFQCCLQHKWHSAVTLVKSVAAVPVVLRGHAGPSLGIWVDLLFRSATKTQNLGWESSEVLSRLNHQVRSYPSVLLKTQTLIKL